MAARRIVSPERERVEWGTFHTNIPLPLRPDGSGPAAADPDVRAPAEGLPRAQAYAPDGQQDKIESAKASIRQRTMWVAVSLCLYRYRWATMYAPAHPFQGAWLASTKA